MQATTATTNKLQQQQEENITHWQNAANRRCHLWNSCWHAPGTGTGTAPLRGRLNRGREGGRWGVLGCCAYEIISVPLPPLCHGAAFGLRRHFLPQFAAATATAAAVQHFMVMCCARLAPNSSRPDTKPFMDPLHSLPHPPLRRPWQAERAINWLIKRRVASFSLSPLDWLLSSWHIIWISPSICQVPTGHARWLLTRFTHSTCLLLHAALQHAACHFCCGRCCCCCCCHCVWSLSHCRLISGNCRQFHHPSCLATLLLLSSHICWTVSKTRSAVRHKALQKRLVQSCP